MQRRRRVGRARPNYGSLRGWFLSDQDSGLKTHEREAFCGSLTRVLWRRSQRRADGGFRLANLQSACGGRLAVARQRLPELHQRRQRGERFPRRPADWGCLSLPGAFVSPLPDGLMFTLRAVVGARLHGAGRGSAAELRSALGPGQNGGRPRVLLDEGFDATEDGSALQRIILSRRSREKNP